MLSQLTPLEPAEAQLGLHLTLVDDAVAGPGSLLQFPALGFNTVAAGQLVELLEIVRPQHACVLGDFVPTGIHGHLPHLMRDDRHRRVAIRILIVPVGVRHAQTIDDRPGAGIRCVSEKSSHGVMARAVEAA